MKNSSTRPSCAVAIFVLIAFCGIGCKTESSETGDQATKEIDKKIDSNVIKVEAKFKNNAIALNNFNDLVVDYYSGGTIASSPLKVRGGAATFHAKTKWKTDATTGLPCVVIKDTSQISLSGVTRITAIPIPVPDPPLTKGDDSVTVPAGWQMDIYGRMPDGKSESPNGVRLLQTSTCDTNQSGVYLKPEVNIDGSATFSLFYGTNDGLQDEAKDRYNKRFLDVTPASGHPAGPPYLCDASDPKLLTGDRDLCEHAWSIYISNRPQPDPKHHSDYAYRCVSGGCEIEIGKAE